MDSSHILNRGHPTITTVEAYASRNHCILLIGTDVTWCFHDAHSISICKELHRIWQWNMTDYYTIYKCHKLVKSHWCNICQLSESGITSATFGFSSTTYCWRVINIKFHKTFPVTKKINYGRTKILRHFCLSGARCHIVYKYPTALLSICYNEWPCFDSPSFSCLNNRKHREAKFIGLS